MGCDSSGSGRALAQKSAKGHSRHFRPFSGTSALPLKADMKADSLDVRLVPKADIELQALEMFVYDQPVLKY